MDLLISVGFTLSNHTNQLPVTKLSQVLLVIAMNRSVWYNYGLILYLFTNKRPGNTTRCSKKTNTSPGHGVTPNLWSIPGDLTRQWFVAGSCWCRALPIVISGVFVPHPHVESRQQTVRELGWRQCGPDIWHHSWLAFWTYFRAKYYSRHFLHYWTSYEFLTTVVVNKNNKKHTKNEITQFNVESGPLIRRSPKIPKMVRTFLFLLHCKRWPLKSNGPERFSKQHIYRHKRWKHPPLLCIVSKSINDIFVI